MDHQERTRHDKAGLLDSASKSDTARDREIPNLQRHHVSARLCVTALVGATLLLILIVGIWQHVFPGSSGPESPAVAATSCEPNAPVFEVTFNRDYIPAGGLVDGPLTADSPRVTQVYVRQSGALVPASLEIIDDDYGVRMVSFSPDDPNDPNILGLVHSGSRSGRITLRVEDPNDPNDYDDVEIDIGSGCTSCGGGCTAGAIVIDPDGIDVGFKLGKLDRHDTAGLLRIRSDTPCADLSTPAGLIYRLEHDDVEVLEDSSTGDLAQILAPQALADIVTVNSTKYEIRFYGADDVGTEDPNTGLYVQDPNDMVLKWVIESTDGSPDYEQLEISKVVDGDTEVVYQYNYVEITAGEYWLWQLYTDETMQSPYDRNEVAMWNHDDPNDLWTRTYQNTQDGGTHQKTIEIYSEFDWGKAVTQRSVMLDPSGDPDDPNDALITYFGYYDSGVSTKGRLKWIDNHDGSWQYYTYETDGRVESVMSGWEDYGVNLASQTPSSGSARIIEYDYETDPNAAVIPDGPICVTEKVEGTAVSLTDYDYSEDPNTADLIVDVKRCTNPTAASGSRTYLTTTTTYDGYDVRYPLEVEYPDDRLATYVYDDGGTYTDSGTPVNASFDPNTAGTDDRVTVTWGTTSAPNGVADKTTRKVVVTDGLGIRVLQETYVCETAGSNYERIDWTVTRHDGFGRAEYVYFSNNTQIENTWSDCCGLTGTVGKTNIETTYVRDSLQRVTSSTKEGVAARTDPNCPAQEDITTSYDFAVASNLRTVTTTVSDESSNELESATVYDLAGRVVSQTDQADLETSYDYDTTAQGGRKVTVTLPNGGTRITEYYRDGRLSGGGE